MIPSPMLDYRRAAEFIYNTRDHVSPDLDYS